MECRTVWPVAARLGEGPAWIAAESGLYFVDIHGGCIHRYDPATAETRTITVGGRPSFIVPIDGGGLLVGRDDCLHRLDGDRLGPAIARLAMPAHDRMNDATVDPQGRLWFGTMDDREQVPSGAVHVFDHGKIDRAGGACVITNGPAVSPDGRLLYHVDTLAGRIWRFEIGAQPVLEAGTLLAEIDRKDGLPDGVTVDGEGCLWVGLWDGWAARRYDPEGRLMLSVPLPCANVTKVAFGGQDLRQAFVTTARAGLSDEALAAQPLAGALFSFAAPAPGVPLPGVRLAP